MVRLLESAAAAERLAAAAQFLDSIAPGTEVLIVGPSRAAVDDLVRGLSVHRPATFGWHRFTLTQLAARLAAPALSADALAPCTALAAEAVATRASFEALRTDRIPFFAPVARYPGFGSTLAATVAELRTAGIASAELAALGQPSDQLALLLDGYETQLRSAKLARPHGPAACGDRRGRRRSDHAPALAVARHRRRRRRRARARRGALRPRARDADHAAGG
jgi:hypothetical protein